MLCRQDPVAKDLRLRAWLQTKYLDEQGQTEWLTIGIQCRDICKPLGGTAILDACRKSLSYQVEKAAYHMDHLIFIAPEIVSIHNLFHQILFD